MLYLGMRCYMMTKSISIQQILLNQIQIPSKLLTSYKALGMNEQEVMVVIQLHRFLLEHNDFPTPYELSSFLTIDEKECANILRKLIQKKLLTIQQLENENQLSEAYCLNPLWEKLFTDRKSTRLNSSHVAISYAVFCLKKKKKINKNHIP